MPLLPLTEQHGLMTNLLYGHNLPSEPLPLYIISLAELRDSHKNRFPLAEKQLGAEVLRESFIPTLAWSCPLVSDCDEHLRNPNLTLDYRGLRSEIHIHHFIKSPSHCIHTAPHSRAVLDDVGTYVNFGLLMAGQDLHQKFSRKKQIRQRRTDDKDFNIYK